MSTHTPGPWFTTDNKRAPLFISEAHGEDIATVHDRGTAGTDVANARLIAAAPDLLAALRDLLAYCDNTVPYFRTNSAEAAIAAQADAAIAKAEGK